MSAIAEQGREQEQAPTAVDDVQEYAAIDLGSNSFHMVVARYHDNNLTIIDRVREMVRLGSGLDDKGNLTEEAADRALECLIRFGDRLRGMETENVRIVGTNTLRKARNARKFLFRAEDAVGFPIDIIAGVEEARLIYLGVSETLKEDRGQRLVVDIGGGSTELIIGDTQRPRYLESLYMGCVSATQQYFKKGKISASRMKKAILGASVELEPHVSKLMKTSWQDAIGTSGTARSIERVLRENEYSEGGITADGLESLVDRLIEIGHVDDLKMAGLGERRQPVFIGGVAVMTAIFRALGIKHMRISDGSLREGVLAELIGRSERHDTRADTVKDVIRRHQVDEAQAERVCQVAANLYKQSKKDWGLNKRDRQLLLWAAQLHEMGLMVAHNSHHKHGAYLLEHMDLAGFSRQEQTALSVLVRLHRRKLDTAVLEQCMSAHSEKLLRLVILLRLAVLLNRSRSEEQHPDIRIETEDHTLTLIFEDHWLSEHSLTQADLELEQDWLLGAGITLFIRDENSQ